MASLINPSILPKHIPISPISIAAMLENIINYTNLVETAGFLLGKYRDFYVYKTEVTDEIGKRRIDIDINVELIAKLRNNEMLQFVFTNSDVLMRPYVVKLHLPRDTKIRRTIHVQKTPEQNREIVSRTIKKKPFFFC